MLNPLYLYSISAYAKSVPVELRMYASCTTPQYKFGGTLYEDIYPSRLDDMIEDILSVAGAGTNLIGVGGWVDKKGDLHKENSVVFQKVLLINPNGFVDDLFGGSLEGEVTSFVKACFVPIRYYDQEQVILVVNVYGARPLMGIIESGDIEGVIADRIITYIKDVVREMSWQLVE